MLTPASPRAWYALILGYLLVSTCSVQAAPAAPLPPTIQKLDTKSFCPASGGLVSKNLLARTIIDAYKIPQSMVDWNDTGNIGEVENTRAVSTYLCGNAVTPRQVQMCESIDEKEGGQAIKTAGALTQEQMVQDLSRAFSLAEQDHPDGKGGFYLELTNVTVHFARRGAPATPLNVKRNPLFSAAPSPLVAEVFSSDFFDISCAKKAASSPSPGANAPTSGSPAPTSPAATQTLLDHFRLRATPNDLDVARDSDAFAGLQAATLAIVNDDIAKKNTFDMNLVLGYALPTLQFGAGDTVLDSIPFFQYDRDYVDGAKAPPMSSNVNNAIGGIQENLTFPIVDSFYSALIFQPEYIWSLRSGAEIAKLHLAFQPEPLLPYVGFAAPIGILGFSATAYAQAVFNYGEVTRPTSDPTLAQTNNFAQGGVYLNCSIFNKDESSILNGFSFPVTYTNLYGFSGQYKAIELFTAAANYTFPKTKYVTIGLSYTDGRNVDTFEMEKVYKVSLGVKY